MPMRHLLLATVEDPHNPASWSGTPFHMRQALEQQFERVTVLSSPIPQRGWLDAAVRLLLGRTRYPLWMTRTALHAYARRLEAAVAQHRPDAVLCISSQHLVCAKPLGVPVYMVSDAPWMAYKQAYRTYEAMPLRATHYARLEAHAARTVDGLVYPTPWACTEAAQRFGPDAAPIHRLPFGANSFCAESDGQVQERIVQRRLRPLRLLFIGKDWERKGGPLAVDVVRALRQRGVQASLDIVGCNPPLDAQALPLVRLLGFLSPANAQHRARLSQVFSEADFFLVPSQAECFGLVFAEAQSYGLPCIALANQGVPGVVDDHTTGLLFDPHTTAQAIAQRVEALINDPTAYQQMAMAARHKFSRELNWAAFGRGMHALIHGQPETAP